MPATLPHSFPTPRTDAAERFFHVAGKPPSGFVDSTVSRLLELELAQALAHLQKHGVEAPPALDSRALSAHSRPRRAGSAMMQGAAPALGSGSPSSAVAQSRLLTASLAQGLGEPRDYADGSTLYRRGERTEHMFFLLQGQLAVSQQQEGADESEDRVRGPGHVFAEHGLFQPGVHTETLTALGPVRCALVPLPPLQSLLAADSSVLPQVLMALALQYRQVLHIASVLGTGRSMERHALMGPRTLTRPELHRALADALAQAPGSGPLPGQLMCLKLQAGDHLASRLLRAGQSLGSPQDLESLGLGMVLVQGRAQVRIGAHVLELGQGSVVGVAEGLTGQPFSWQHMAVQEVDVRAFPVERALARLERADPALRALAAHLCALILNEQRSFQG
jgi:CRP-like cAMP-binding protein